MEQMFQKQNCKHYQTCSQDCWQDWFQTFEYLVCLLSPVIVVLVFWYPMIVDNLQLAMSLDL